MHERLLQVMNYLAKQLQICIKLIAYFESWADLQNTKKMAVNWNGLEF
jgi:hypothetical protein